VSLSDASLQTKLLSRPQPALIYRVPPIQDTYPITATSSRDHSQLRTLVCSNMLLLSVQHYSEMPADEV